MLTEILAYLRNDFVREIHKGTFEIVGGNIAPLDFLIPNQYFRIVGSVLNDGVYCYGDTLELLDETFGGEIWVLAIPPDLLKLADEITDFMASDEARPSAYTAESFDGYSYTKATDSDGVGVSWQAVFAKRLRRWRKI